MTTRVPLLACIAVLSFFAGVTGVRLAYTLTYVLVLLMAVAYCWSRIVSRRLVVTRDAPEGTFTVGEPFAERFVVRNGSRLAVPYCEIHDLTRLAGYAPGRACSLGPGEALSWTASGVFSERGRHRFGGVEARLGDPFGLFPQTVRLGEECEILVYPTIHPLDVMPRTEGGSGESRRGRPADVPPDVSSIREHEAGDGLNRIHWASTARTGRLMSRTFDTNHSGDLLIALDLQSGIHTGTPPESSLEYAISVAASLCHAALRRGQAVALVANDSSDTAFPAARGEAQRMRLLDYLATATDDGRSPLATTIARHGRAWRGRGGIVVVTGRCDQSWVEALLDTGVRGRRHLCAFIDTTSFGSGGSPLRLTAAWRLVLDWWVIRRGDVLGATSRSRAAGL